MSGNNRIFPSFGVTRGRNRHNNSNINNANNQELSQQQQQPVQSPQQIIVNNNTKIPVTNIQQQGNLGDLVINNSDKILYYHNGNNWVALSNTTELVKNEQNNLLITAQKSPRGSGGNVIISSGQGGLADGQVHFQVGGDTALTISEENILVEKNVDVKNDFTVSGSTKLSKLHVEKLTTLVKRVSISEPPKEENTDETTVQESTAEDTETAIVENDKCMSKETEVHSEKFIIEIEKLKEVNTLVINNSTVKSTSLVSVSCQSTEGVPYAWITELNDGKLTINIVGLNYSVLGKVYLHVSVQNDV